MKKIIMLIFSLLPVSMHYGMQRQSQSTLEAIIEIAELYDSLQKHAKAFRDNNYAIPTVTKERWLANREAYSAILSSLIKKPTQKNGFLLEPLVKGLKTINFICDGANECPKQLIDTFEKTLGNYIAKLEEELRC